MKILTAAQMQLVDRITTERYGVPSLTLMENAGRGVVEFLEARFAPLSAQQVLILCGRGNNGGDGFVVARLLRERRASPRVILLARSERLRGDAAINFERLAATGVPEAVEDLAAWERLKPTLQDASIVVDGILGTGLSKPLEGFLLEVVRDVNHSFPHARVVAIDLPTGLSADTGELIGECVRAHASITFTTPKMAHIFPPACEYVGEWLVKQIGTPPEALDDPEMFLELIQATDLAWVVEPRKLTSHKGTYGHVLVVAGSVGKTGAAAMTATAALRAGAGLVTVATPQSALPVVASLGVEFMTEPLPETEVGSVSRRALDDGRLDKLMEGKSVVAVGPGLGMHAETAEVVRTLVNRCPAAVVLDADGLNAFAGCATSLRTDGRVRILTPHPGEMARLVGKTTAAVVQDRIQVAREFARERQVHLVLKGFRTLVASPAGRVSVNSTGNPGMATGGTGDVLTGLAAGLLAQHLDRPHEVTAAAVYLHGLAGDLAAREMGEASMIAGDLLEAVPRAFKELRNKTGGL